MDIRAVIDDEDIEQYTLLHYKCGEILVDHRNKGLIDVEYPNIYPSDIKYTDDDCVAIYYSSFQFIDPGYVYEEPIVSNSRVIFVHMDEFTDL